MKKKKRKKKGICTFFIKQEGKRKCVHVPHCILRSFTSQHLVDANTRKMYCKVAISIPRIQVSLSSTLSTPPPVLLKLLQGDLIADLLYSEHLSRSNLRLQYFCQHFQNIFLHWVCILKGMALPQKRLLYLASFVWIVTKAICHHKSCNI